MLGIVRIATCGEPLEMHLSEPAPGETPNPVHPHLNEKILVIREGTPLVERGDPVRARVRPGVE